MNIKNEEIPRKVLPLIFVIDTSGSMYGTRIGAVNSAMEEIKSVVGEISRNNSDAETRIGVLQFSTTAKWVTNGILKMDDFYWNQLDAAGTTMYAEMLDELHDKLSRSAYMKNEVGFCVPALIFITDGAPTDDNGVWENKLEWVKKNNKWFEHAIKVAIAIDQETDIACLEKLVGSRESVIYIDKKGDLAKLITTVSATLSKIGSESRTPNQIDPGKKAVEEAVKEGAGKKIGKDGKPVDPPPAGPTGGSDGPDGPDGPGGWGDPKGW